MSIFLDSIFSSIALSHFMVDTFNASRPVLLTYLGLSETQIALFSTIYIWASALTQPFFGWLSDRIGPRWLAAGGVAYTAGVAFYAARRMPYGHFVWHLCVLAGTACHFVAVLNYAV